MTKSPCSKDEDNDHGEGGAECHKVVGMNISTEATWDHLSSRVRCIVAVVVVVVVTNIPHSLERRPHINDRHLDRKMGGIVGGMIQHIGHDARGEF